MNDLPLSLSPSVDTKLLVLTFVLQKSQRGSCAAGQSDPVLLLQGLSWKCSFCCIHCLAVCVFITKTPRCNILVHASLAWACTLHTFCTPNSSHWAAAVPSLLQKASKSKKKSTKASVDFRFLKYADGFNPLRNDHVFFFSYSTSQEIGVSASYPCPGSPHAGGTTQPRACRLINVRVLPTFWSSVVGAQSSFSLFYRSFVSLSLVPSPGHWLSY